MRAGSGWAPSGRNASSISASELKADGIEAAGFPADLTDRSTLPDLISAITARCGQITVLQYAPAGPDRMSRQTDVRQCGAESFEFPLDLLLRTPAELIRRLLPTCWPAASAASCSDSRPPPPGRTPQLANAGAAARAYLECLHVSLPGTGVHAGLLQVGGMVANSDSARVAGARRPSPTP